jgi:gliding motility-associated-like protein
LTVTINAQSTPLFTVIGPLCQNTTPPNLPLTSTNGITGTWNPSAITTNAVGTFTYAFTPATGQCAGKTSINITVLAQTTPLFTAINPICKNTWAPDLPTTSNNGITGTWNPATINVGIVKTGTYTFTPAIGQCADIATLDVKIFDRTTPTFATIGSLCLNSTPPILPSVSSEGVAGTWNPATISTAALGKTSYYFTPTEECAWVIQKEISVISKITPTFVQIGPLCQYSTPPNLPATSTNGITGTWSPAKITTADAGSATYTFTPNPDQCAVETKMDIAVSSSIIPTFTDIKSLCINSTPPTLPTLSTNGITGKWSPATISTAIAGTFNFTFTPDPAGPCASVVKVPITIDALTTPPFDPIGPLCINSTPPDLPLASTTGITGTWNPATINTSAVGSRTYTFTPAAGQCAGTRTMVIKINAQTVPLFTSIASICQNAAVPVLPLTSTNGITGTWSPGTINTSSTGTFTFAFTPATGQCVTPATMAITITDPITPLFTAIGPLCLNTTAPALPLASANGITGTWNPASINTATAGVSTYTFTPAAGQCAIVETMDITITNPVTPLFAAIGSVCQNTTAQALPLRSANGITGTWNPSIISTSTVGTFTYTFTPEAGQCAVATTMVISITKPTTPDFTAIAPVCQNDIAPVLPFLSTNNITGNWSPATVSTATAGTFTFTFTPDQGQCATTGTLKIVVNSTIKPSFAAIGPLCQNSTAPILPSISMNGVTGIWNPALIRTSDVGTTTYTFTPNQGQCAGQATLDITVTKKLVPVFATIAPLCQNSTAPALPLTSTNGVTGTWNPATINTSTTGTTTFTFTPAATACAETATMDILVNPIQTSVTNTSVCSNQLPYSWNKGTFNAAGTYQVKLVSAKGCDSIATLNLKVVNIVTPAFAQIGPLFQNSVAPTLPPYSTNGINGTWNPATISTVNTGTTTYTFTPAQGECATSVTMDIAIQIDAVISGLSLTGVCQGSTLDASKSLGDIVKYEWSLLDQGGTLTQISGLNTDFKLSPTYKGSLPADFRVQLLVTNRNGLTSTDIISIKVDPLPVADVFLSGNLEKDGSMIVDGSVSTGAAIHYKWSTTTGSIIGSNDQPTVKLFGAGFYTLEVADIHGCLSSKTFKYPLEIHSIQAKPDRVRISWDQDTTIHVMANDISTDPLIPGSVKVVTQPTRGGTKVNTDGTITYSPNGRYTGTDQFIYSVCEENNLCDEATVTIDIYTDGIKVPEGFSPNGDGANDKLVFQGLIENYPKSELYVYTRSGQLVYQSVEYLNDWGGETIKSTLTNTQLVPTGTYYYVLKLGDTNRVIKGFVYIGY